MFSQVDPENLILKTRQHEFSDGLRDIQIGLTLIIFGISYSRFFTPSGFLFLANLNQNFGAWAGFIGFLLLFLPILIAWGTEPIIHYLRRRWVWRESGIVKPSRIMVPGRITVISAVVFLSTMALGLKFQPVLKTGDYYTFSLMFLAAGWGTSISFIGFGRRVRVSRYVYTGALGGLASTAILLYQNSLHGVVLILFLGWGLILLISGFIVLKGTWSDLKEASHAG